MTEGALGRLGNGRLTPAQVLREAEELGRWLGRYKGKRSEWDEHRTGEERGLVETLGEFYLTEGIVSDPTLQAHPSPFAARFLLTSLNRNRQLERELESFWVRYTLMALMGEMRHVYDSRFPCDTLPLRFPLVGELLKWGVGCIGLVNTLPPVQEVVGDLSQRRMGMWWVGWVLGSEHVDRGTREQAVREIWRLFGLPKVWWGGFGGKKWARIARNLLQHLHKPLPPKVFIDSCVGLAHNNSFYVDKLIGFTNALTLAALCTLKSTQPDAPSLLRSLTPPISTFYIPSPRGRNRITSTPGVVLARLEVMYRVLRGKYGEGMGYLEKIGALGVRTQGGSGG